MPDTCIKQSSTIHLPTAKLTKFGIPSFFDATSREFPRTTQVTNVQKKKHNSLCHILEFQTELKSIFAETFLHAYSGLRG